MFSDRANAAALLLDWVQEMRRSNNAVVEFVEE